MNIFQILNNILFKRKDITELDIEGQSNFIPFLINRWISFYSPVHACFINETFNKLSSLFDDKAEYYKLYCNLTPKVKFKKIEYVKKRKEKDKKEISVEDDMIRIFAKNNFLSSRELKLYVDLSKTLIK
jgi:hypothetical protein